MLSCRAVIIMTLRKRIGQYIRFGSGEPVGHWGGRYIWQLEDADNLLFCWRAVKESEDAEEFESELIADFNVQYGGFRPFANLKDSARHLYGIVIIGSRYFGCCWKFPVMSCFLISLP